MSKEGEMSARKFIEQLPYFSLLTKKRCWRWIVLNRVDLFVAFAFIVAALIQA